MSNQTVTVSQVAKLIHNDPKYVGRAMAALMLVNHLLTRKDRESVLYFAGWSVLGVSRNANVHLTIVASTKLIAGRKCPRVLTGKHLKHARSIALAHVGAIAGVEYTAQVERNIREAAERAKEQRAIVDAVCASVESDAWLRYIAACADVSCAPHTADPMPATKRSA